MFRVRRFFEPSDVHLPPSPPSADAGVTPKRPEATCFTFERAESPFCSPLRCGKVAERPSSSASEMGVQRISSSPPSPELERAPARFAGRSGAAVLPWAAERL